MIGKLCPVCDLPLKDGDEVAAVFLTIYREIPSETVGAVDEPRKCIEIVHKECFDFEEYDDSPLIGGIS